MSTRTRLAEMVSKPSPPAATRDYGPAFGLLDGSVINVEGRNYVPQKPSLRVRLHNWLIGGEQ